MKPQGSSAFEVCADSPRAQVFVAWCSAGLSSGTVPSTITPPASSDTSSFTQQQSSRKPCVGPGLGGPWSPPVRCLALPSTIPAQLAHISLPWGAELTPVCSGTEPGGSQATCPVLPALSEELFCSFQSPLLSASFPVSFLCLLVLSISRPCPWQ